MYKCKIAPHLFVIAAELFLKFVYYVNLLQLKARLKARCLLMKTWLACVLVT